MQNSWVSHQKSAMGQTLISCILGYTFQMKPYEHVTFTDNERDKKLRDNLPYIKMFSIKKNPLKSIFYNCSFPDYWF